MAEKLTGMEMMFRSLLNAAGFKPDEITENISQTVQHFKTAAENLQQRLDAIDARLQRIEVALDIKEAQNGGQQKLTVIQ